MPCKKVSYSSKKFADDDIKRFSNSDRAKRPINSYLCEHCNTWHLTSRPTFEQVQQLVDDLRFVTGEYNKTKNELEKLKKDYQKVLNIKASPQAMKKLTTAERMEIKRDEVVKSMKAQLERYQEMENAGVLNESNLKTFVFEIRYRVGDTGFETQMLSFESLNEVQAKKLARNVRERVTSAKLIGIIDKKIQENLSQINN